MYTFIEFLQEEKNNSVNLIEYLYENFSTSRTMKLIEPFLDKIYISKLEDLENLLQEFVTEFKANKTQTKKFNTLLKKFLSSSRNVDKDEPDFDIIQGIRSYTVAGSPSSITSLPQNISTSSQKYKFKRWLSSGYTGKGIKLYHGEHYFESDLEKNYDCLNTKGSIIDISSQSFTEDFGRALTFANKKSFSGKDVVTIVFELHGGTVGRDIQEYSVYPEEKEHVSNTTKFKIIEYTYNESLNIPVILIEKV